MGSTSSFYGALLIPALIAGATYLLLSFIILPLWTRYKTRYTRYLPLSAVSSASTTVRDRIADFITAYMLPGRWRAELQQNGAENQDSEEELDEYSHITETEANRRREALSLSLERNTERRLSRDLEQGFASDSDSDAEDGRARRT